MSDDPFQVDDVTEDQDDVFASSSNDNAQTVDPFAQSNEESQPAQGDDFGFSAPAASESAAAEPAATEYDPFGASSATETHSAQPEFEHKDELAASAQETPLQQWQQKRREVLAKRKQDSEDAKKKLAEDAKAELAKFHQQREEAIQKTMAANRLDEQNVKKDFEALMKTGTMWEKVGKLTNLQPKANEDRRVSRMRKLLVQLKNKNDNAE